MVQGGHGPRLALEAAEPLGVAGERFRQDLHRHLPPQPRVARAVDLTHAAHADEAEDFVAPEPGPGQQRELLSPRGHGGLLHQLLGLARVGEQRAHLVAQCFVAAALGSEKHLPFSRYALERRVVQLLDTLPVGTDQGASAAAGALRSPRFISRSSHAFESLQSRRTV